ncbi:hypothetical protein, partial [Halorubrum ezzemoulense]|uniref:hypothetical protein n=1 Tax=Halorubrum ezzemoulense TaxID=337243 RepID=UPI00232B43AD
PEAPVRELLEVDPARINRGTDSDLDFLVEGLTPDADPGGIDHQKRLFGNFWRSIPPASTAGRTATSTSSSRGSRRTRIRAG